MSIHVICPGCLKRFQVGVRFAGMKGPCPACGTIITIPKESAKIQEVAPFRAVPRSDLEFDPVLVRRYGLGALVALLLALLIGGIPMYDILRSLIGILGLCLIAFPLMLFGYQIMRDREQMFALTGEELYRRAGLVAGGYVVLWIVFEIFLTATHADAFISGLYFIAFAILATLLAHPILLLRIREALLHFCLFGFTVILLRFLIGLGWFWESGGLIRYTAAPPSPFLPGM